MKSGLFDPPASRIDPDAFLFTGADPCWTPAREFKAPGSPDAAPGLCCLCGGDDGMLVVDGDGTPFLHPNGSPVVLSAIPDGSRRVCGRCMKAGRGPKHAETTADPEVPVACEDMPGYVTRGGVTVPERFARLMKG